jgi:hypothetical protein
MMKLLLKIIFLSSILVSCRTIKETHTETSTIQYRDTTFITPADTTRGEFNVGSIIDEIRANKPTKSSIVNHYFYLKDTSGKALVKQYIDALGVLHEELILTQSKHKAQIATITKTINDKLVITQKPSLFQRIKNNWVLYLLVSFIVGMQVFKLIRK